MVKIVFGLVLAFSINAASEVPGEVQSPPHERIIRFQRIINEMPLPRTKRILEQKIQQLLSSPTTKLPPKKICVFCPIFR